MPRVSVIIPTHNCAGYLDGSISSALSQSYEDLEVIIVDNGSNDNTDEVVAGHLGDPRLKYLKMARANVSAARNFAVANAKGGLIAFLDADDLFMKNKLLRQVNLFDKDGREQVSYTNELYFKNGSREELVSTYHHFSGDIFYYLKRSDFIHTSTFMARKVVLEENLFDEALTSHEDWDLFLRLARKGIGFAYIDEPLSKVRVRPDSATKNKGIMDATRNEVGLRARQYWKDFKKEMSLASGSGRRAVSRYLKFKICAFFIGFPGRRRFNRPVPQELL